MKIKILITFVLTTTFVFAQKTTTVLPIIPQPNSIFLSDGHFVLSDSTLIIANSSSEEANYLKQYILDNYNIEIKISDKSKAVNNTIAFLPLSADILPDPGDEDYTLDISKDHIFIKSGTNAGSFYAIQTLIQMLPVQKNAHLNIPCVQIVDSPRYKWRGMHLDCSRHFFTKEEVEKYIDYIAMYKMNVFHWHLTDDQGWRIEIKKYPLLAQISSQRKETIIGKPVDTKGKPLPGIKYDGKPYGGYYTQDDIREVVAYAAKRHVTIVPEIEMPGHSLAALAAYPQLSCSGGPFETYTTWGVSDDVFCAGNDSTFSFLQNVIDEVMTLFPGSYIHIGGDECPKDRWKVCPKCQKRIADEHLKDEHELQSYFITRMEKYINSKGRQIIGWDEILEGGLAPNASVMSWRGTQGGIDAAKQNHFVVMTPGKPCYFDHYQTKDRSTEPMAIGGFNPVDSVYKYDPTPKSLTPVEQKYIMGAQGNVWTEYIPDFAHVQYMAVPRMSALSEVLWTKPENKNYKSFQARFVLHAQLLDRMKVNYAKHILKGK